MPLCRSACDRALAGGLGILIALTATPCPAAESARAAANYLAQLAGGLVLVILTILALAWILRRLPVMAGQNRPLIEILAVRAVGARERMMLVQVGEEQILIGLTPTGMRHLHTLRQAVTVTPASVEPGSAVEFATLFKRATARWTAR